MADGNKSRSIRPSHEKRLFALSGNQCAHPDCHRPVVAHDDKTIAGKICHIEAVSRGGARYNLDMSDDDCRHFDNLILLCDEHHSVIDNMENEAKFPVNQLKIWKKENEDNQKNTLLRRNPLLLTRGINAISAVDFEEAPDVLKEGSTSFVIENKINDNALKRNRELIKEYSLYYAKINSIYGELESQGSFKKEKLLRSIRKIYLRVKGQFINGRKNEMEIIQKHADDIFEAVEEQLSKQVEEQHIAGDDVFFAIPIVMVDAFMRCKILEGPKT